MNGEQYREAARELVGTRKAADAFSATSVDAVPTTSDAFKLGSDNSAGGLIRAAFSQAVSMGNLEVGQVSVSLSGSAAAQAQQDRDKREREEKRSFEDRLHDMLLNRIQFHEDRMRETGDRLRTIYGDDIVGGLAAKYLTPEQIANARSEEELMLELKSVLLDDEGHIRPEYAGTDDALYVYDWNQTRELRSNLDELPTASPERKQEIYQGIREEDNVTLNYERSALQRDEEAANIAREAIVEDAAIGASQERENANTPLPFV